MISTALSRVICLTRFALRIQSVELHIKAFNGGFTGVYTDKELKFYLANCPNIYRKDGTYCACISDKSWRYMPHWQFQGVMAKTGMIANTIPQYNQKARFIHNVEKQCLKSFNGDQWSAKGIHDWRSEQNKKLIDRGTPIEYPE